jgi:hypothetical protein|tara:strand:- start:4732 stop:4935 length:204 start_codon:yes stop_codon:yes gene_type:complete
MPQLQVKCINSNKFEDKDLVRFTYFSQDPASMESRADITISIPKGDTLFDKYVPGEVYDVTIAAPKK